MVPKRKKKGLLWWTHRFAPSVKPVLGPQTYHILTPLRTFFIGTVSVYTLLGAWVEFCVARFFPIAAF